MLSHKLEQPDGEQHADYPPEFKDSRHVPAPSTLADGRVGRDRQRPILMMFMDFLRERQAQWARDHLPVPLARMYGSLWYKPVSRRLMQAAGLRVPDALAEGVRLREAMACVSRVNRCFLKPESSGAGKGTLGLVRTSNGFANTVTGEERSAREWKLYLEEASRSHRLRNRWIVEDLMLAPGTQEMPPVEYKFYAFAGRVLLVFGRRTICGREALADRQWRPPMVLWQCFDADWRPVATGLRQDLLDRSIPPLFGKLAEEGLQCAERASRCVLLPFVRVDMFSSHLGMGVRPSRGPTGSANGRAGVSSP